MNKPIDLAEALNQEKVWVEIRSSFTYDKIIQEHTSNRPVYESKLFTGTSNSGMEYIESVKRYEDGTTWKVISWASEYNKSWRCWKQKPTCDEINEYKWDV